MSKENIINKLKKLSNSWADIGTILGQTSINDYMFYLKKFKAKKGDIVAAEAKLPTGEGKVIDVIVWGRIMEIVSSNDFLPNEATKELTEENINIQDTILPLTKPRLYLYCKKSWLYKKCCFKKNGINSA